MKLIGREARALERKHGTAVRRTALLALLAALCALGFLQASAVGGHTSVAKNDATISGGGFSISSTILVKLTFTVSVTVSGPGSVTSSPGGIDCSSGTCSAVFTTGTTVTLTANKGSLVSFNGWGGDCSGTGGCSVSGGASVTAGFASLIVATISPILTVPTLQIVTTTPTTTPGSTSSPSSTSTSPSASTPGSTPTASSNAPLPVIQTEPVTTTAAPFVPPVKAGLSIAVSGAGTVKGAGLTCGGESSKCFGSFKPGTTVTLHAGPSSGNKFAGWSGGCKGLRPMCVIRLSRTGNIVATFAPKSGAGVPVSISRAAFDVKWAESQGSGNLQVKGRIAKPSLVLLQLHRASGSKVLLTTKLSLPAGPFSLSIKLLPGLLADGQPLLPGSFVVSLGGHSGTLAVPTQVRAITLSPPPTGVVAKAFASTSSHGKPASTIPASRKTAFVRFVFQSLPSAKQKLTVAWYEPGGKLLGVAQKPNAPDVTSSISSKGALPKGTWRVDLRAGNTVVKSVPIQVG